MKSELVTTLKRMATKVAVLELIARGERAIQDGRVKSHKAARKQMSRWLR